MRRDRDSAGSDQHVFLPLRVLEVVPEFSLGMTSSAAAGIWQLLPPPDE